jgi:hypothetical protein
MDDQANQVGAGPGAAALGRGGRMSPQRKTVTVLRLLRGEDLETVSRSLGEDVRRLLRKRANT